MPPSPIRTANRSSLLGMLLITHGTKNKIILILGLGLGFRAESPSPKD